MRLLALICTLLGHDVQRWDGHIYPTGRCDRCGRRVMR